MDYYIKELQDGEFVLCNWESLMFLLSVALSCIYISTILYDILLKVVRGMLTFDKLRLQKFFVI